MKKSQNKIEHKIKLILDQEGFKKNLVKAKQLKQGNVNNIFVLNKDTVLRVSDDATSCKRLVREAKLLKSLHHKIPVPEVYSYGSIGKLGYQILSFVQGDRLSNVWPNLSKTDKSKIIKQFTKVLNVLHSIKGKEYGTICIPSGNHKTWIEYCDSEFNKVIRYLKQKDLLQKTMRDSLDYYASNKKYLAESFNSVLVHGDLHLDNILIHNKQISAILDFEFSSYSPIEYELYKLEEFARDPKKYGHNFKSSPYYDFIKYLKVEYPDIFNQSNLKEKIDLYDFIYTWKAFKYNDEFNMIDREKNLKVTQTKIKKILENKISRII